MVGRHLGRDHQPVGLGVAHFFDGAARADVRDVHAPAGQPRQCHVAGDHDVLGRGRHPAQPQPQRGRAFVHAAAHGQVHVFFVHADRHVEHGTVFQGAPHQVGVHDRSSVVGNGDCAGVNHVPDVGQFLAPESFRQGADRKDARQAGGARLLADEAGHCGGVVDRVGIRHAGHAGEAAGDRGARTGQHRLLVLVARLAQMNVHVDQPRGDHAARHVDPVGLDPGESVGRAHLADGAVFHQQVEAGFPRFLRVHDRSAGDDEPHPPTPRPRAWAAGSAPAAAGRGARLCRDPARRPGGRPPARRGRCGPASSADTAPPCARPRRWSPVRE